MQAKTGEFQTVDQLQSEITREKYQNEWQIYVVVSNPINIPIMQ